MAYSFTVNQLLSTTSKSIEAWVALKTLLVAAGWTVPRSADGTTYNPSGDQGGLDNTNAWLVLQQPTGGTAPYAGTRQICLQRTTNGNTARVKYSLSAGFTGGSPSATRVPSAADEVVLLGSGTDASPTGSALGSTAQQRFQVIAGGATENFGFAIVAWTPGGTSPTHTIFEPLQSYTPGDTDPFMLLVDGAKPPLAANIAANDGWGWSRMGDTTYKQLAAYDYGNAQGVAMPDGFGTNPFNSKDDHLPILCGRRTAQTSPGYKGFTFLSKWTGVARSVGDTGNVAATKDRIIVGQLSFPWDGVTTPTI